MANDGWEQGWHEKNGGNYRIVWGLVNGGRRTRYRSSNQ